MGMSEEDLLKVTENVSIVFHCAASISFVKPLRYVFLHNLGGVNNAIELCKNLKHCEAFVDTSTAYSNCNRKLVFEERIYRLPYSAERFLEYLVNGNDEALQELCSEIKPDYPNHYVFSKGVSENLILEKCSEIPTAIIRPAIVAASWKGALPGYAEEHSSMAQLIIGIGKGFVKVVKCNPKVNFEIIPVDVVANAHVVAAYSVAIGRHSSPFVVNCTLYGMPLLFTDIVPMLMKLIQENPVPNAFRFSSHLWVVNNEAERIILSVIEHYIPAVGLDLVLILKGKKPKLFSLYRFLDRVMKLSSDFTRRKFEFATENFQDLKNAVSPEMAEELYTQFNGFEMKEFLDQLVTGAPQYDWSKDKLPKPERVKLIKRVYYFTIFIQVLSIIFIFWALYTVGSLVINMILFKGVIPNNCKLF